MLNKKILSTTFIFIVLIMMSFATANRDIITDLQEQNTYVLASQKDVDAVIIGDLFLITMESNIEGTINRDLNAISSKIDVQGLIGDDLRLISGDTTVNAIIFGELRAISNDLTLANTTVVNGKTNIRATNVNMHGGYRNDVRIIANNIELNAIISGNVDLDAKNIIIHNNTRIGGTLTVPEGTEIPKNAVNGEIIFREKKMTIKSTKDLLMEKITLFLLVVILAGFLHLVANQQTDQAITKITNKLLISLLLGIAAMIIIPIITIISLITIITAPIGAVVLIGLLALAILTPAIAVLIIGKYFMALIRTRREIRLEILIGALFIVLISFIPGLFILTMMLFFALALGTLVLSFFPEGKSKKRKTKGKAK